MKCVEIAALLLVILNLRVAATFRHKICRGSLISAFSQDGYQYLKDRYTNCTFVVGNLQISMLQTGLDFSFLKDIREVTGYVTIRNVDIPRLVLPNLAIIRGRDLTYTIAEGSGFALLVEVNDMKALELPALREISSGKVLIQRNKNLCYTNTIKWEDIVKDIDTQAVTIQASPESCPACHESCTDGCWGPGPLSCQKFSKINCDPRCGGRHCFRPTERECCHLFCAGACSGPTQSNCSACENFNDDGVCKEECPPMWRHNPITSSWERNPEGKYAYEAICVENCPERFFGDDKACVESCPDTKTAVDGECVPCGDGPCPRVCHSENNGYIRPSNIHRFQGCNTIDGDLKIDSSTFKGFLGPVDKSFIMHPKELEVFSTLKVVTGKVRITGKHQDFKNLFYFRNLEIIQGRSQSEQCALYISDTSLESLNLRLLREVQYGDLKITKNPNLCFASGIDWKKLMGSNPGHVDVSDNAAKDCCRVRGLVCHEQCSNHGCWGTGPEECFSCENYKMNDTCIPECNSTLGVYDVGNRICDQCDFECIGGCVGRGSTNCSSCRNVRDGPYCVGECPVNKYNENGECLPCDENCVNGCTGPKTTLGSGGCNSCHKAILSNSTDNLQAECLKLDETCPDGFYSSLYDEGIIKTLSGKMVCRKCHDRCKNCTAYGILISVCDCLKYRVGKQCEDTCPQDHYSDNSNFECVKCDEECLGCYGPSSMKCSACTNYRIDFYSNGTVFNCTASCPADKPYTVFDYKRKYTYCSDVDPKASLYQGNDINIPAIIGGVLGGFVFTTVCGAFVYKRKQRNRRNENNLLNTMGLLRIIYEGLQGGRQDGGRNKKDTADNDE